MSWRVKITAINWIVTPAINQSIEFSFREGGSMGPFTIAGTATFNPAGDLISTPNPFIIVGDHAWASMEVQAINHCSEIVFSKTFNNPDPPIIGCIALGIIGTPSLPDAVVDSAYNYFFDLSGDGPFELSADMVKPAWMNIILADDRIIFYGIADTPAVDSEVTIAISNCEGVNTIPFSDTVTVTA